MSFFIPTQFNYTVQTFSSKANIEPYLIASEACIKLMAYIDFFNFYSNEIYLAPPTEVVFVYDW